MAEILIVDDEIGIRELLSEILADEGHVPHLAENAAEARKLRQSFQPDLVLLDIWMPDVDGITLLKEWAAHDLLTMPVIMMSGHANIETAVEATRIGALDFLEKPITMQKLMGAVRKGLDHRANYPVQKPKTPVDVVKTEPEKVGQPLTGLSAGMSPQEAVSSLSELQQRLAGINLQRPLRDVRDDLERIYFENLIADAAGSMTKIAEVSGLERTHLYRKLKQLGINAGKRAYKAGLQD